VFAGLTRQRFELPECSRNTAAFISAPSCLSIHPPYLTISATHRPTHHLVLPSLNPPNLHLSPAALSLDKSPSLVLCTLRSNTSIGIWTFSVTTSTLLAAAFSSFRHHCPVLWPEALSLPRPIPSINTFNPTQSNTITLPDPTTTPARFPSKTPKGVDNYDNSIENIECSDEIYPRAT
jgi:hypothetical protein